MHASFLFRRNAEQLQSRYHEEVGGPMIGSERRNQEPDKMRDTAEPLKVLHYEASAQDAELVREQLARAGFQLSLRRAETPSAYLKALREGDLDLILADYCLAGLDGASLLRLTRQHCPDVPLIFVSAMPLKDAALQALRSGAQDYVL
jgi:CheY-like chemotaxis protein